MCQQIIFVHVNFSGSQRQNPDSSKSESTRMNQFNTWQWAQQLDEAALEVLCKVWWCHSDVIRVVSDWPWDWPLVVVFFNYWGVPLKWSPVHHLCPQYLKQWHSWQSSDADSKLQAETPFLEQMWCIHFYLFHSYPQGGPLK